MKKNTVKKTSDFTLLFAEDNPQLRTLYTKIFTQEGYRVFTCESAAQILAELKEEKFDLLVTDLEMPASNTLELFPILKKEYPGLPVVIVTGHYRDLKDDFLDRGYTITAFLNKPIGVSVLKEKIAEILKISPK